MLFSAIWGKTPLKDQARHHIAYGKRATTENVAASAAKTFAPGFL
jgi:hypothetical protein